jgi:prepilin signal peptidase PulO-like enzyme (type II secretory pathway)
VLDIIMALLTIMELAVLLYVPWDIPNYSSIYRTVLAILFVFLSLAYFVLGRHWTYFFGAAAGILLFFAYKDYWFWVKRRLANKASAAPPDQATER